MITVKTKETHVFIKDENSFTAITKRPNRGIYQVFSTKKISPAHADNIEGLYEAIKVLRINIEKGFILLSLKKGSNYNIIVEAVKNVLYGES